MSISVVNKELMVKGKEMIKLYMGEVFYQNGKMLDGYFLRKVKKKLIRTSYDRRVNFPNI